MTRMIRRKSTSVCRVPDIALGFLLQPVPLVGALVEDHRQLNRPLATWRNGMVVYMDPRNRNVLREVPEGYGSSIVPWDGGCPELCA